ncbi:MAG: hypothetical protein B7Z29_03375 [Hyphomicrobium sp. 12-62-95]|nr:MAG: hypothetical protein B7Z29_03375 [Hyphomicrobium sp. 12-62-95]
MNGTIGDDIIDALAGDDVVDGDAGSDTIYGREGFDNLRGGFGNDTIYGGADGDTIYGGSGADTLYGEGGDDRLFSEGGGGTMDGGEGNDQLYAGSYGGPAETLIGGAGNDYLAAVGQIETADAGEGDDRVYIYRYGYDSGGPGTVTLGSGADTIELDSSAAYAADTYIGTQGIITDFATGAGGDKINIRSALGSCVWCRTGRTRFCRWIRTARRAAKTSAPCSCSRTLPPQASPLRTLRPRGPLRADSSCSADLTSTPSKVELGTTNFMASPTTMCSTARREPTNSSAVMERTLSPVARAMTNSTAEMGTIPPFLPAIGLTIRCPARHRPSR